MSKTAEQMEKFSYVYKIFIYISSHLLNTIIIYNKKNVKELNIYNLVNKFVKTKTATLIISNNNQKAVIVIGYIAKRSHKYNKADIA